VSETPREAPSRVLSLLDASAIVVGSVIGVGIFFTPAGVAERLPSRGGILAAWAAGGAIALVGALVFAELGAALPAAGGPYVFLRAAFGRLPAFLFGWVYSFVVTPGVLAVDLLVFAQNAAVAAGGLGALAQVALALAVLAGLAGANLRGARHGAAVQKGATFAKLAALAAILAAGLLLIPGESSAATPPVAANEAAPPLFTLGRFGAALVFVLFSYGGWQVSTFVGGEVRDPGRTLPRAIVAGMVLVCAVYLAANLAFLSLLSPQEIAVSETPAADAVGVALGPAAGRLVAGAVALSALGLANAVCLGNTRIAYAMAQDVRPLRFLGSLSPRGVPAAAIATQAGLGALLILYTAIAGEGSLGPLVNGVAFPDWIAFGSVGAALVVLRRKRPDLPRPYRSPAFPLLPLLFVGASAFAAASALRRYPAESLGVAAFTAVGALVFALRRGEGAAIAAGSERP
jgi:APA family basic amino acid/polyamine antiporter